MAVVVQNDDKGSDVVKFVSYSGKYPNLCSGVLHLVVNEQHYLFGPSYKISDDKKKDKKYKIFQSFWYSGGNCGFVGGYGVHSGEWRINKSQLPVELQEYAYQIDEVFNYNVKFGCCGGCL